MRVGQFVWTSRRGFGGALQKEANRRAQWLLAFGSARVLEDEAVLQEITGAYPEALLLGCTTAGEIAGMRLHLDSLVLTEIELECSSIRGACVELAKTAGSFEAGFSL